MAALDGKVLITTSEGRPCWVDGRRAIFHRWIDSARPAKARGKENDPAAPHFQLYNVHGLVEFEDGTLRRVWATDIQFADSAEAFGGICWEQLEHRRDALPFTFGEEETGATIEVPADRAHPDALKLAQRILKEKEKDEESGLRFYSTMQPVVGEKVCVTCAHAEDGNAEDCERAMWACSKCTVAGCHCSGCEDHNKWTPKT